jgi:hypothetical protein
MAYKQQTNKQHSITYKYSIMKEILIAKWKETKEDYNTLGLYTYEEYNARLDILRELLSLCNNTISLSLTEEEINNTL